MDELHDMQPSEEMTFREQFFYNISLSVDYEQMIAQEEKDKDTKRPDYFQLFDQLSATDFVHKLEEIGPDRLEEARWGLEEAARHSDSELHWLWFVFTPEGIVFLDNICEQNKIEPIDLHLWVWGKIRQDYEIHSYKYEALLDEWDSSI